MLERSRVSFAVALLVLEQISRPERDVSDRRGIPCELRNPSSVSESCLATAHVSGFLLNHLIKRKGHYAARFRLLEHFIWLRVQTPDVVRNRHFAR